MSGCVPAVGTLGLVHQHHAECADDVAVGIAQRHPADQEGAGLVGQQVDHDRLAGLDHLRQQGVGHHRFDALAPISGPGVSACDERAWATGSQVLS